ncbi:MAG: TMEM43 family protein [Aureliella sp.]
MSPGKRIGGVILGCGIGFVLVAASVGLLSWNEYRTIHRSRGLAEANRDATSLPAQQPADPRLKGKLVHLTGTTQTEDALQDPVFGVRKNAVHLRRRVEMYQWNEDEETNREGHTTYSYDLRWMEGRIASEEFHDSVSHENPTLDFRSEKWSAGVTRLGAFQLNRRLQEKMDRWQDEAVTEVLLREILQEKFESNCAFEDNTLFWNQKRKPIPSDPVLGDLRIRFDFVPDGDVSVLAALQGETFAEYRTSNGEPLEDLYSEVLTLNEFIGKLRTANTLFAFALRIGGCVFCCAGIGLVLGPIRAVFGWVPLLGDIAGGLVALVAVTSGLILSLLTIAIAWLAVRPLLAGALLVLVGLLSFVLWKLWKSVRSEPPVIATS